MNTLTPPSPPAATPSATSPSPRLAEPFGVMAKPIGPLCNLACDYCFDAANSALRDTLELPTARTIVDYIIRVPVAEPLIGFLGGC